MPLSDIIVYSAFTEFLDQNKKEKQVRCRYCQRDSAKHTSCQQDHLIKCKAYLKTIDKQKQNKNITRKEAGVVDKSQQPLFANKIPPHKRKQLNKLAAMAIYYGGRQLGLYEDLAMKELFADGIGWIPPSRDRIAGTLLNETFLETQEKVEKLLNESQFLNFISDKSNNQPGD